jgi:hypothetical protein
MKTTSARRSHRVGAVLLSAGLLATGAFGAACGSDDDNKADATEIEKEATTTTEATETDAAADDVVEVTAVDYAVQGLPEKIEAGTKLALANDAPAELHELVVMRLPDEEKRPVSELVKLPEEEIGKLFGSTQPATVLLAAPGGEQINAVGDGTISEPGRYAVICSIPTGADPQAFLDAAAESNGGPPQTAGGPPHLAHGMFAELIVE